MTSAKLTTRYLAEQDFPAWMDLVANSPEGSIYSTPEYLDVLCSETDGRFRILVAERGGEMAGGIALFERSNMWGTYVGGRLLLYYNGFVLKPHASKYPSERTAKQLETLAALEEPIAKNGYGRVRIRNRDALQDVRVFLERGWGAQPSYSYVVALAGLDGLWARIEQNLRDGSARLAAREARMNEAGQKVTAAHLKRNAYLYVRQSTPRQVGQERRSTHGPARGGLRGRRRARPCPTMNNSDRSAQACATAC